LDPRGKKYEEDGEIYIISNIWNTIFETTREEMWKDENIT
jgi:hypothetical protein